MKAEQTNSSIIFGDRMVLKLFRMLEQGLNPDLEIGRMLTERAHFEHTPPLAAWMEYHCGRDEPRTMAVVHAFVPNQGDAWTHALDELGRFFERALTNKDHPVELPAGPLTDLVAEDGPPPFDSELIGAYLDVVGLLGRRTAEMHLALALPTEDPEFASEPYSALYQRSEYQSMRNLAGHVFRTLRSCLSSLPESDQQYAADLLAHQDRVMARFQDYLNHKFSVIRMRCHGDLHLGQVLYTGKDFAIIDFEGEPARPLTERRRKRSALRDVAGMLRSFHYAAHGAMLGQLRAGTLSSSVLETLRPWARLWENWVSWAFLREYLNTARGADFLPRDNEQLRILLDAFLLDKAVYELGYELNNRPDWVTIPLLGIGRIVGVGA